MGITPRFKKEEVLTQLRNGQQQIASGIIRLLQRAGETFVNDARSAMNISPSAFPKGDYQDQTANLRSSIGYFILKDGSVLHQNLQGTPEGNSAARTVLGTIKMSQKQGFQLIGVAGMDYASHVESRGYNVITSQGDVALVNIREMVVSLKDELNKREYKGSVTGIR